jgi:hypothetical protein
MPPWPSVYAPTTIGELRMPSSIVSRVRAGRQSIAVRNLVIGSRATPDTVRALRAGVNA